MGLAEAHNPTVLDHYEGLVFKTSQMLAGKVEDDVDDIQQILRIKVYKALLAFDPTHTTRMKRDAYVFMCVRDQAKDLVRKRKRGELYIEDLAGRDGDGRDESPDCSGGDRFVERYLSASHDQVFGTIDDDDLLIPNTLSDLELEIVSLLYCGYRQSEIAPQLGLHKRAMECAMRSVRVKLADWRPDAPAVVALDEPVALAA